MLVRRLNADGTTWARPVLLDDREGRGVDCEAHDAVDPSRPPLRIQVTRPRMPDGFWKGLNRDSVAEVPPGATVEDEAARLWDAIDAKGGAAHREVVLALNPIRTPWLGLPSVVEAFRVRYGESAARKGWATIWVVGGQETFTQRLDRVQRA